MRWPRSRRPPSPRVAAAVGRCGRPALLPLLLRSRSRRAPILLGLALLLLPLLLQLLLLLSTTADAFATVPHAAGVRPTSSSCCSIGGVGVSVGRRAGLLRMKKEDGRVKKPIKRVCATNKYAKSSYEIGKKFEAGISLVGTEIAPIVSGSCQLRDAYCRVKDGELWIFNLFVGPHKTTGKYFQHQEKRPRRLLVHKREILELRNAAEREGQTIVPLRIYLNADHRIKVEIAVGKGVKKYDKRETIREREMKRGFERILKAF